LIRQRDGASPGRHLPPRTWSSVHATEAHGDAATDKRQCAAFATARQFVRWLCARRSWLDRDQKGTPMMTKIHALMATLDVAVTVEYKIPGDKPSATLKVWGLD